MTTVLNAMGRAISGLMIVILVLVGGAGVATAQEASSSQTAWRLLDYLSVDYAGAVKDGKVIKDYDINSKTPGVDVIQLGVYVDDLAGAVSSKSVWDEFFDHNGRCELAHVELLE